CIFLLNPDGTFTFVNSRADAVLGMQRKEIIGRSFLDLIPAEFREGIQNRIESARSRGEGQNFEMDVIRTDGRKTAVSFSLAPLEDQEGILIHLLGIGRDVTQERGIQERMVQLERMLSLGQLVSGMAHELNNPLTSIVGFAQILAGDETLPKPVQKRIGLVFKEGERARAIVQNLLAFAKPPDKKQTHTNINETLQKALELSRHDIQDAGAQVVTCFEDLPSLKGDESLLLQAFLAVLKNAIQASKEGQEAGRLVVKTWRIENEIHVAVTDNGPGIPTENLRRIFDPFFTTKEVGQGTGLGLSIGYRIITAHDGRITVDSTPGKETTFEVILPVPVAPVPGN
ncbi:MAG: two-component system sensor histidine kinase NtrB, partial [Planctomycetota bacterium]